MLYGFYLSAQGAEVQSRRLDVVANNLANANTTGFKRDLALVQAHRPYDVEQATGAVLPSGLERSTGGTTLAEVVTDFSDGSLDATGATFDVALNGPGFLRISDGVRESLTRDGALAVTANGEIVTRNGGERVLDPNSRPIVVPPGAKEVTIREDGVVEAVGPDGQRGAVGRIDLVRPRSLEDLEKIGRNQFVALGPLEAAGPGVRLRQGYLEGSGVEAVRETVRMIEASRAFETNMNILRLQDESLGRLLQAVPGR